MTRKRKSKKKLEIIFDAKKRREFLTGFQKRKNERRKRAKEELERNIKEERKRIRKEIKDGVKHMKKSYEPLKELTEADKRNENEYEDDDVKVKIVELTTGDLAAKQNMLGDNFAQDSQDSENGEYSSEEEEDVKNIVNCVPGMDFNINSKRKHKPEDNSTKSKDNYYSGDYAKNLKKISKTTVEEDMKSKKDLDHLKKIKTLKKLKMSKVFKMKELLDKKLNQKKARRNKNNTIRSLPKHLREKKKFEKNPYIRGRKINKKQHRKKFEK